MTSAASSIGLLFRIEGDSSDAVKAINDVDEKSKGLTSSLGDLTNAASIVGAGIIAVGAAALAVGRQIFSLTQAAAEYGSTIFDASQKTGLSAETLSSLQLAANQAGSSLEAVTSATAKFARTIGEAEGGSDKAQAALKRLGVTSMDIDVALGQALKTIAALPPGVQQMTAAQAAFGKSGADLIPVLRSFDGDLEKLVRSTKEMGLALTEEGMIAADQFGDQMDTLNAQIDAAGRTIGFAFMPIFLDFSQSLSGWLSQNSSELETWASRIARVFQNAIRGLQEVISFVQNNADTIRTVLGLLTLGASEGALDTVRRIIGVVEEDFQKYRSNQPARGSAGGSVGERIGIPSNTPAARSAGSKAPSDDSAREAERLAREAERIERERIETARQYMADETEFFAAEIQKRIASVELAVSQGKKSEDELFKFRQERETEVTEFRLAKLREYLAALIAGTDAYKTATQQVRILEQDLETQRARAAAAQLDRTKKQVEEEARLRKARVDSWNEYIRGLKELADREAEADAKMAERMRQSTEASMASAPGTLTGGIFEGLGGGSLVSIFDELTNGLVTFQQRLLDVKADINSFVGEAIGGMIGGLTQMAAAWLSTGEFSGRAAMQMLASVALSIAGQAAIKAVFEAAEAVAAAARWDFVAAGLHSTAAGMYATVATVAAGAGVGLALGARAMGGGKASSAFSAATSGGMGNSENANPSAIRRQSDGAFASGRGTPWQQGQAMLSNAAAQLRDAASTMKEAIAPLVPMNPGDVLTAGSRQRPEAIGDGMIRAITKNSSYGNQILKLSGAR